MPSFPLTQKRKKGGWNTAKIVVERTGVVRKVRLPVRKKKKKRGNTGARFPVADGR